MATDKYQPDAKPDKTSDGSDLDFSSSTDSLPILPETSDIVLEFSTHNLRECIISGGGYRYSVTTTSEKWGTQPWVTSIFRTTGAGAGTDTLVAEIHWARVPWNTTKLNMHVGSRQGWISEDQLLIPKYKFSRYVLWC